MAEVSFHEITKVFPNGTTAVDALTCTIADGEFMVLVGPSGCGKTTALRMIAGLEEPTSGAIAIGGKVVNGVSPRDRDIAMVFQNYALYPHKTVLQNLAFGLRQHKVPNAQIVERVREVSSLLTLDELLDRKPAQLSGGQRQRVAMGRALARSPRVFLLDEPLSNLDAQLRTQLRTDLKQLHQRFLTTTVYVTHDQVEAMTLGDRIAVMSDGKLLQLGTPQEIYRRPANVFVAGFIGSPPMNLLSATAADGRVHAGDLELAVPGVPAGELVIGVRPEALRLVTDATEDQAMQVRTEVVELLGHETIVYGSIRGQNVATATSGAGSSLPSGRAKVIARLDARRQPAVGETITLAMSL
ncbi:MAG TPA: sn-glycerol-3-phosphate ABC transporter ATP-binding protein UgpC, partial [Polyangia bacterium]|nr:sn-glycerol-3-phosphate ABC transporter ATP-binding protein UgpC [Polyangia bacterium]